MWFIIANFIGIGATQQAVLSSSVEGWNSINATAVDYDTFNRITKPGAITFLGPRGIYTTAEDNAFVYVDMFPNGELATKNLTKYKDLIKFLTDAPIAGLEFMEDGDKPDDAYCSQICAEEGYIAICKTCRCKFASRYCGNYLTTALIPINVCKIP